jgi:uncharacterized damage-inducible protein DinB
MYVSRYAKYLEGREPIAAMRENVARIRRLIDSWSPETFERSYAPGKWPARVILTHLAQTELAFGNRARMALTVPGYAAQSFDQDRWIAREANLSGREAAEIFFALSGMNAALYQSLSTADRQMAFTHPEHGAVSIEAFMQHAAGHQIHHLRQLEQISRS